MPENFEILLYYFYTEIKNPEEYCKKHLKLCQDLNLKGRILIAKEGINGTVSGLFENTQKYQHFLKNDPLSAGVEFKKDFYHQHTFPRLSVKVRSEIVTFGIDKAKAKNGGIHLNPTQFQEMMDKEDVIVLDARNDYESNLGHFKEAILPNISHFRDLPKWVRKNRSLFGRKKILTYCTGGVRCERFTALLKEEGIKEVFQLKGGIIEYGRDEVAQGENFLGKCYVFDSRVSVPINQVNPEIISRCCHCDIPCERYLNCANADCNQQYFCCESCEIEKQRCCRKSCQETIKAVNGV